MMASRLMQGAITMSMWSYPIMGLGGPSEAQDAASVDETHDFLVIDVDPSTLDASEFERWLEETGQRTLEKRDELPQHSSVVVHLEGLTFDYTLTLELRRHGRAIEQQPTPVRCNCSSEELLKVFVESLDRAVDRLIEDEQAEQEVIQVEPTQGMPDPEPVVATPTTDETPVRLGTLGVAGAFSAALGCASMLAGGVMVAISPQSVATPDYLTRDWRPPGIVALGVGAGILISGVTMLVVDRVRCRRAPERCKRRKR